MSLREENLNVTLAELLSERGLKALGEVIMRKKGKRHNSMSKSEN